MVHRKKHENFPQILTKQKADIAILTPNKIDFKVKFSSSYRVISKDINQSQNIFKLVCI